MRTKEIENRKYITNKQRKSKERLKIKYKKLITYLLIGVYRSCWTPIQFSKLKLDVFGQYMIALDT